MRNKEDSIHRIIEELQRLPEPYLKSVYEIVRTMRTNLPALSPQQKGPPAEPPPFIDEIERVKEQSHDVPGRKGDQYFT